MLQSDLMAGCDTEQWAGVDPDTNYIASDDIAVTDRLERQIAYLDTHPENRMCGGYYEKFFRDSTPVVSRPALTHNGILLHLLFV